ncbi:hypothetical protein [Teredinibacter purpureus]|uniref:hypothetical protein n=1 Tax=Teredinibacter purpureus TaxID=2731756 RepID=UPI00069923D7|nr:hypothetical protein [Teredinibacter purpureus]
MTTECGNCGRTLEGKKSPAPFFLGGINAKLCSGCSHRVKEQLVGVRHLLFKSISIATAATIVLPLMFVFVLSVASNQVSFGYSSQFFFQKAESLGSIILLLNFVVVFLGLSVPDIMRYRDVRR